MNNKWFRLAIVSFVGIIMSVIALYLVQTISGASSLNAKHQTMPGMSDPNQQMQHGGSDQTMTGMPGMSDPNQGQGVMQYTAQVPAQYPNPGIGYGPNFNPGMGFAPNANPYAQYNPMQYQIYLMRQQINQIQQQLNANNAGGMSNNAGSMSNNGGGGMNSMPMM